MKAPSCAARVALPPNLTPNFLSQIIRDQNH
jgi:hypothetical protein